MVNLTTVNFIKLFEGLRLHPYKDTTGTPTIGYGATFYENGTKVQLSDAPISELKAQNLLHSHLNLFSSSVKKLISSNVNENQLGACTSFAYNVGLNGFKNSTLLKKINANPNDATIEAEFNKYTFSKGVKLNGLVKRRQAEYDLYKKKTNLINEIMNKIKTFISTHKALSIFIGVAVTFGTFMLVKRLRNGKK